MNSDGTIKTKLKGEIQQIDDNESPEDQDIELPCIWYQCIKEKEKAKPVDSSQEIDHLMLRKKKTSSSSSVSKIMQKMTSEDSKDTMCNILGIDKA